MADLVIEHNHLTAPAIRRFSPIVAIVLLLALVPLISKATGDVFLIRAFTRVILFAMVAVALNIILGLGGLISMMHAGLFGIGAYTVAILAYHDFSQERLFGVLPGTSELLISLPCAVLVTTVCAALFGSVAVRTSGTYFIMITLAFNQMLYYFFVSFQHYGGEDGLQILSSTTLAGFSSTDRIPFYYICLVTLAGSLIFTAKLRESKFGLVLRAMAQNERRVVAVGLASNWYKLAAFVISSALAGLAGGLWANSQQFVSPADMSWIRSGDFIVMIVLGGTRHTLGPVMGAVAYLMLELVLSSWTTYWQLPLGLFIVTVVVFLHDGLAGAILGLLPSRQAGL
jgi:branched-chain amino acid transport system permease protein